MGCRYTIGVYDREPGEFRKREVQLEVRRPGLSVHHARSYSFRSPDERRQGRLTAAWMAPEAFPGGLVRAHLFPLRPSSSKLWEGMLVVEFPPVALSDGSSSVQIQFGAVLRSGTEIPHRFSRELSVRNPTGAPLADRKVSFVQRVLLEPGTYELTCVADAKGGERLFATRHQVALPEIPRGEPFLVGPVLGRRAGRDVVVRGGGLPKGKKELVDHPAGDVVGTSSSFLPILVSEIEKREAVAAWTSACLVARSKAPRSATLERTLVDDRGAGAGTLTPLELSLRSDDAFRCEQALDIVPVGSLRPGSYRFEAKLVEAGATQPTQSAVPFAVVPKGSPSPATDGDAGR